MLAQRAHNATTNGALPKRSQVTRKPFPTRLNKVLIIYKCSLTLTHCSHNARTTRPQCYHQWRSSKALASHSQTLPNTFEQGPDHLQVLADSNALLAQCSHNAPTMLPPMALFQSARKSLANPSQHV